MKKKSNKKKEVSNEDLARMMAGGLQDVQIQVTDLSKVVEKGFEVMIGELGKIAERVDKIYYELLVDHEQRIKKVEKKLQRADR